MGNRTLYTQQTMKIS